MQARNNISRLYSIITRNYKNFCGPKAGSGDQQVELEIILSNLNIFIGPNGSGKSNFIAVLQFLRDCLTPVDTPSRGVTAFEDAIANFGGEHILDGTLSKPATVGLTYSFSRSDDSLIVLELELLIPAGAKFSDITIKKEKLMRQKPWDSKNPFIFYAFHDKQSGQGVYSVFNPDDKQLERRSSHWEMLKDVPVNDLVLLEIDQLLEESEFAPELTPLYPVRRQLIDLVSKWQFYNSNYMALNEIRSAEPKIGPRDRFVNSAGTNLALVFDNLVQEDINFEEKILNEMKTILPGTRKVRATRVGRLALTMEWYLEGMDTPLYLTDLSDGTVRMLCWATILLSPHLPKLLVIDEPEVGLHVAWMSTLADWIKEAARNTQIIISTHSPDLLDKFTDMPESVCVFQPIERDHIHYRVERLNNNRLQSWFDDEWELGDLYRIGDPVVGGWPSW